MDLCHRKHAELEKHFQKYRGRVVLQEDNVEDDNGFRAAFAEQSASVSQMAVANMLATVTQTSRYGKRSKRRSFSIHASTHVGCAQIVKKERAQVWITLPISRRPKQWHASEEPLVTLERNLDGHPLAGLLWERRYEEVLF